MKKLLALFITLLSLNLYGADKPIFSQHGLKGWGKKDGVHILVEDYSAKDKTFDVKAIKNQVELKLRLAGIKVSDKLVPDMLEINIQPIPYNGRIFGYALRVSPRRWMSYEVDGNVYRSIGGSKHYTGITSPDHRKLLDKSLDELLIDYLKENPKK